MNNLSFYLLSAEEILIVSTKIKEIITENLSSDLFCSKVLPLITSANANLSEAIGRDTIQSYTHELSVADDEQDDAFIGFRDYVKAFTNNPDSEKQAAANTLIDVIKKIGWSIWSEGYVNESALMKVLFAELDKEENMTAMTAIGATDWYEHLKTKHAAFEALGQQKITAEAGKDTPLTSSTKKELAKYINPLLSYIELLADMEGGAYTLAANELDEAIAEVMTIARSRQTRKNNAVSEE
ncbi:DUF6261 family protein [Geofilum sp. OHC36d9]|uniref:DUF6261 family protein n=1 Tax=Geofilum sp. OHC36d9 TaxID=3458413 RepID=UPI0040332AFB